MAKGVTIVHESPCPQETSRRSHPELRRLAGVRAGCRNPERSEGSIHSHPLVILSEDAPYKCASESKDLCIPLPCHPGVVLSEGRNTSPGPSRRTLRLSPYSPGAIISPSSAPRLVILSRGRGERS